MTSSLFVDKAEEILKYYRDEISNRDPDRSYIEASNDLFGFNGSNIDLDKFEVLFHKYQLEMGKSRNIIESFNKLLDERIPELIMNVKIEDPSKDSFITFENVKVYKPYMLGNSQGKTYEGLPSINNIVPMYPRDALINQLPYEAEFRVDMYSKHKRSNGEFSKQLLESNVSFMKVPIVKGCKYCWLYDMTDEEKINAGECFNDPLGYYIIDGMEKVMVSKESIKASQMVVTKDSKKNSSQIFMYSLTTNNSIKIALGIDHKNDNLIEVTVHEKPPVPVFILSLFLQYLYDEELVQRSKTYPEMMKTCRTVLEKIIVPEVLEFVAKNERQRVKSRLLSTIIKSLTSIEREIVSYLDKNANSSNETIIDPIMILSKRLDQVKKDLTFKRTEKNQFSSFINEIKMNVFPTPDDDAFNNETESNDTDTSDFNRRRLMLAKMVSVFARHLEGLRSEDDRDSYTIKRIDTSARQMETHFSLIMRAWIKEIKTSSPKLDSEIPSKRLKNRIRSGIKHSKKRENVSEPIQRITPAAVYSQLQRVSIPRNDSNSKNVEVRVIKTSQTGYICTAETPEGENCGVVKNLTTICWVSLSRNVDLVEDMIQPYISEEKESEDFLVLLLDGDIRGWINPSDYLSLKRDIKRNKETFDVTVCLNYNDYQVDIFTTGSLPTRPLLLTDPETGLLTLDSLSEDEMVNASIMDLVEGGYLEFNSPLEIESRYPTDISNDTLWNQYNKGYTYIKIAEFPQDVALLVEAHSKGERLDEQPYTHSEMIPHAQFGYSGSCVPKANLNKGPRVTFQCSMFKQALAGYHSVHTERYDAGFKIQQFPTRTCFETVTHEPIGLNAMPSTATPILAIIVKPMNNEDAIVGKREWFDNNLRFVSYSTHTINIMGDIIDIRPENEDNPILHALFKASDVGRELPDGKIVSSDLIGFPKPGAYVKKGDAILGKYTRKMDPLTGKTLYIPSHSPIGLGKDGFVMGVEIVKDKKVVRVKIAQYRRQIPGDKIASRYSQKGTYSEMVAEKDMPRIVGGLNDGVVPDMCFNALSIPSRQTQGKIIEILASAGFVRTGKRINSGAFGEYMNDDYMESYEDILENFGLSRVGEETLRHPNGELIEAKIYTGPCAYQMLKHHVADKFQVRDTGRLDPLTHQPVRGRFNEGGIRMGEMERDSQISHGTMEVVQDRMMKSSCQYRLICCTQCGNIAQSNFEPQETTCSYCTNSTQFGVLNLPFATHLTLRMFNGAGIHVHFKFAKELEK